MPLITFEGIDGAGKTPALTEVEQMLSAQGLPVLVTSDFSSCPAARLLKPLMVGEENAWAQYALIVGARVITHRTLVNAALRDGVIVLYDRYVDSTHAYQGSLGVDHTRIDQDHAQCELPMPDLVLMLDLPVEAAMARKGKPVDRMDTLTPSFYQVVRHAFLDRSLNLCRRHALINANRDLSAVAADCVHAIKLHLAGDARPSTSNNQAKSVA